MPNHLPVLVNEVLRALQIQPGAWYLDATFGRGGHTRAMLGAGAKIIAFDVDQEAITFGEHTFIQEITQKKFILIRQNFELLAKTIHELQAQNQVSAIQGILFDFGTSSNQLTDTKRGFSFEGDAELDMRMDDRLGVKAKDLLAILPEKQLMQLFSDIGGEHEARSIAHAIAQQRLIQPIVTTHDLVDLILRTKRERRTHLHPATKVFQALRIAVNSELDAIQAALPQAYEVLAPGGRIAAISFHEGEDRLVKQQFKRWEQNNQGEVVNKQLITASQDELDQNPRARSAKLRVFAKKI